MTTTVTRLGGDQEGLPLTASCFGKGVRHCFYWGIGDWFCLFLDWCAAFCCLQIKRRIGETAERDVAEMNMVSRNLSSIANRWWSKNAWSPPFSFSKRCRLGSFQPGLLVQASLDIYLRFQVFHSKFKQCFDSRLQVFWFEIGTAILFKIASLLIHKSVVILFKISSLLIRDLNSDFIWDCKSFDLRLKSVLIRDCKSFDSRFSREFIWDWFQIEKCFYSRLQGFWFEIQ